MIEAVAVTLVFAAGLFFIALGAASLAAPPHVGRFLLAFAGSAPKHYAELAIRIVVGAGFALAAPRLPFSALFSLFGWVLLGTTAILLLLPWRWHHWFAQRAVPGALRFLPLVGLSSMVLGGLVLWAVFRGNVA